MNKKRIIGVIIAIALTGGIITGIVAAVRRTTSSRQVMVIPASDLNFGYGYGEEDVVEGFITSSASQNVYVSDTDTVKEILVTDGQKVKKGDILLVYDQGQAELNLAKEQLMKNQIQMNIDTAKRNIQVLKKIKPTSNSGSDPGVLIPDDPSIIPDFPDFPDEPSSEEPSTEYDPDKPGESEPGGNHGSGDKPGSSDETKPNQSGSSETSMFDIGVEAKATDTLDSDSKAWWSSSSDYKPGSYNNPYRYLVKNGTVIYGSFFNKLRKEAGGKDLFFVIEIRRHNLPREIIRKLWIMNAAELPKLDNDWKSVFKIGTEFEEEKPSSQTPEEKPTKPAEPSTEQPSSSEQPSSTEQPSSSAPLPSSEDNDESVEVPASASQGEPDESTLSARMFSFGTAWLADVRTATAQSLRQRLASGGVLFEVGRVISPNATYTADELAKAKAEEEATLKNLQLDLREAELKVKAAEATVADSKVAAKMDGIVTLRGSVDSIPRDGSALITVNGGEGQYLMGSLPESKLGTVKEGDVIRLMSWMSGGMREATITEISAYPDDSGRFYVGENESAYPFTAVVAESGEPLMEQEYVQVYLNAATQQEDRPMFYLWKAFIRDEDGKKYVYIRDEEGKLKKQEVITGRSAGDGTEIISGVTTEDWIAFPYGSEVREGAKTREGTMSELYGY